jgi:CRP-like cAMP-binding protein
MDIGAALARIPWFSRLPLGLQRRLEASGRIVHLAAGQWVYSEGDPDTGICAVLEGALRLEVSVGPDRDVLIGFAQAPAILGQSHRRGGGPRILTTRAGPASTVLLISDNVLERIARDEPELWRALNELVYAQLDACVHLAAQLLVQRPQARIAARLLQLGTDGTVRAGQSDLAEMCGVTRQVLNRHLAALEVSGVVRRGYRIVHLLAPRALEKIAAG